MGEYEPDDSRDVTQSTRTAPGEPPRTGPREDAARREGERAEREEAAEERRERELEIDTAAAERGYPLGKP